MKNQISLKVLLFIIAGGIWMLVLQNFGLFKKISAQPVNVVNTVDVKGQVGVDGSVDVGNTVDVNISEINGYDNVFFNNSSSDPDKYYRLPIINK